MKLPDSRDREGKYVELEVVRVPHAPCALGCFGSVAQRVRLRVCRSAAGSINGVERKFKHWLKEY